MSQRQVITGDAIPWLKSYQKNVGQSFVTSLPDISEFKGYSLQRWKDWFVETAKLILSKTSDDAVTIFFQSDIKMDGIWVDKGYLCQKAAEDLGHELLFHKIMCRYKPGTATYGRPAYSHLLAFSKNFRSDFKHSTPDVSPSVGEKMWESGMGIEACLLIANFLKDEVRPTCVINPFCGQGSLLAILDVFEIDSIGIERSPKRAEISKKLQFNLLNKNWHHD